MAIELPTLGPQPWTDLSNIHFGLEVEDYQLNMTLPSAQIITTTIHSPPFL